MHGPMNIKLVSTS